MRQIETIRNETSLPSFKRSFDTAVPKSRLFGNCLSGIMFAQIGEGYGIQSSPCVAKRLIYQICKNKTENVELWETTRN